MVELPSTVKTPSPPTEPFQLLPKLKVFIDYMDLEEERQIRSLKATFCMGVTHAAHLMAHAIYTRKKKVKRKKTIKFVQNHLSPEIHHFFPSLRSKTEPQVTLRLLRRVVILLHLFILQLVVCGFITALIGWSL